jgi:hypothetical protein
MSPERFLRKAAALLLMTAGLTALSHSAWGQIELEKTTTFAPMIDVSDTAFQVRVEQRVIIRIPRQTSTSASMGNRSSAKIAATRYKEQKVGKCLLMDRLVGSRPGPKGSLDLVTRDGVLIRAYLGDGCLAREFYAGAYMERPLDGKLCIDRDMLHARTGAKCEVDKFRQLVPQ